MIGRKTSPDVIQEIERLRMSGSSLKSICKSLGLPKSTVASYTRLRPNNQLNSNAGGDAVRTYWDRKREEIVKAATSEWKVVRRDPRMMLFLGLYWGEGFKTQGTIGVTNNDPSIIKICFQVCKQRSPEKNIKVDVFCYPSHDKEHCRFFWNSVLNTEVNIKDAVEQRSEPLEDVHPRCLYGRCTFRYNHYEFFWRVMTWIKLAHDWE
jgi:hypothetical protein